MAREREPRKADDRPESRVLPEVGPLLGGLIAPTAEHVTPVPGLDPIRVELVSDVIARAGDARKRLASGDEAGALAAIGPRAWLAPWEKAVTAAAARVMDEIVGQLEDAAAVSGMPPRRLAMLLPTEEDRRVLAARLAAAGIGLEEVVARDEPVGDWQSMLRRIAGELELAWAGLSAAVRTELAGWESRVREVREWRPPWAPFVAVAGVALAVLIWLGLVLGGYLPVPGWLRPLAEWAWSTGWL